MRQGSGGRRPRGRPHRKQHLSPRSQTFDSNGPEGRVRGNAHQVYEKYLALARDATSAGDRIAAEGFYQFAEHYFRVVNDSTDPQAGGSEQRRFDHRRDARDGQDASPQAESAGDGRRANGADSDGESGARGANGEDVAPQSQQQAEPQAEDTEGVAAPASRRRAPRRRKAAAADDGDAESKESATKRETEPAAP